MLVACRSRAAGRRQLQGACMAGRAGMRADMQAAPPGPTLASRKAGSQRAMLLCTFFTMSSSACTAGGSMHSVRSMLTGGFARQQHPT